MEWNRGPRGCRYGQCCPWFPDLSLKGELRRGAKSSPAPGRISCCWHSSQWVRLPVSVALAVVSMHLTTLSIAALVTTVILCGWVVTCTSSWERRRAIEAVQDCLLRVWKTCHRKVIIPVQDCLTQIAERRARERAPQPRDVTTELSTAPGEFYP